MNDNAGLFDDRVPERNIGPSALYQESLSFRAKIVVTVFMRSIVEDGLRFVRADMSRATSDEK